MALFKFVKAITENKPIDVYNHGKMKRDFTFIDDLVVSVRKLIDAAPSNEINSQHQEYNGDNISPVAPFRVVNVGNSNPTLLTEFIAEIETALKTPAKLNFMPMQPGDVPATSANTDLLFALTDYKPNTSIKEGVQKFVEWYLEYYKK